jgi:hypothetical protein
MFPFMKEESLERLDRTHAWLPEPKNLQAG